MGLKPERIGLPQPVEPQRHFEAERKGKHHGRGQRTGESRHKRDQNVDRRRKASVEPPVEPHERRLEPDREQRADIDIQEELGRAPRVA